MAENFDARNSEGWIRFSVPARTVFTWLGAMLLAGGGGYFGHDYLRDSPASLCYNIECLPSVREYVESSQQAQDARRNEREDRQDEQIRSDATLIVSMSADIKRLKDDVEELEDELREHRVALRSAQAQIAQLEALKDLIERRLNRLETVNPSGG